jgi:hypothetical protein
VINSNFSAEDLRGRWRSPVPAEVFPGIYGIDDFFLSPPFWAIHFNAYSDPDCNGRLFELIIMGAWHLLGPSAKTAGARDANFSRIKTSLCLYAEPLIAAADGEGSGDGHWQAGTWQDVSIGGCHPIDLPGCDESPLEYDLLGLDQDRLYFGQRHHDEDGGTIWNRRAPGLLSYYVVPFTAGQPSVGHGAEWDAEQWFRITSTVTLNRAALAR